MAYVNKIFLLGNCGKDPEVRAFENGGKIANFSLATTKSYKDREGNVQQQTMWHSIQVSGNSVDFVEKFVKRGDLIYVEGELTERSYTAQDGSVRRAYEVRAASVQLVGSRRGEAQQQQQAAAPAQQMLRTAAAIASKPAYQAPAPAPAPAPVGGEFTDDLPF